MSQDPHHTPHVLDVASMKRGIEVLCERDDRLAAIIRDYGPPPFWRRKPGFATLVHIILEQQVSLSSALATFQIIQSTMPLTPQAFLAYPESDWRALTISRQKARYLRALAQAVADTTLEIDQLGQRPDEEVTAQLTQVKGIGRWTAQIYLMMALQRPDIWPVGDLALAIAAQEISQSSQRPSQEELNTIGEVWKPWRTVATMILWHKYLKDRGRSL